MLALGVQALAARKQQGRNGLTDPPARFPVSTTGLKVWMEADYGFGSYVDGQVVTVAANRGSAGNLTVPGGVTGPTWKSGLFGGKPCLDFNGNQVLVTPAASMTMGSYAVFVVGLLSSNINVHCLYQFTDGVAITNFLGLINPAIICLKPAGTSSYGIATTPITRDLRKLWRHRFVDTHASHQLWQNGVQLAVPNDGSLGDPGTATSGAGALYIGSNAGLGAKMIGYVAALLAYSPIPSAAVIASTEAYLSSKWPLE